MSTDASTTFLLDYSKNLITQPILDTLLVLAREAQVETYRDKMFAEYINTSEDRAVLHVALRNFNDFKIQESGVDDVAGILAHIISERSEVAPGKATLGRPSNTIVDPTVHIVSIIDGTHLGETTRV